MADLAALAISPEQRRNKLSPLMKAKAMNITGEKVNFCPFGCTDAELDDVGYCRHLVGFTNDGKLLEPMVRDPVTGRRVVRCKMVPKIEGVTGAEAEYVAVLEPVLKGDKLVLITISSRVYRDVDAETVKKK